VYLPSPSADFELAPAGTHTAICVRVLDLGTQTAVFDGKLKHQVRLSWELPDEMMRNDRPFLVSKTYTWTMNKRGTLRAHLEAWRGVPFADKDFGEGGFDIRNVLGKGCLLTVVHDEIGGEQRAFVTNVSKLMKGQTVGDPVNSVLYLCLSAQRFDKQVFESLHERTRETIAKSPEYQAIVSGRPIEAAAASARVEEDMNDAVPF
jgi:hypothetical protein